MSLYKLIEDVIEHRETDCLISPMLPLLYIYNTAEEFHEWEHTIRVDEIHSGIEDNVGSLSFSLEGELRGWP